MTWPTHAGEVYEEEVDGGELLIHKLLEVRRSVETA